MLGGMRTVVCQTLRVRHRRKHPALHERTIRIPGPVLCAPTGSCLGPTQQGDTIWALVDSTERTAKRADPNILLAQEKQIVLNSRMRTVVSLEVRTSTGFY